MQFPAQPERGGFERQVGVRTVDRQACLALADFFQIGPLGFNFARFVLEHQVRHQIGAGQRGSRAGVELVVQTLAQWVFLQIGNKQTRVHEGGGG